jgi:hypothetical protein
LRFGVRHLTLKIQTRFQLAETAVHVEFRAALFQTESGSRRLQCVDFVALIVDDFCNVGVKMDRFKDASKTSFLCKQEHKAHSRRLVNNKMTIKQEYRAKG